MKAVRKRPSGGLRRLTTKIAPIADRSFSKLEVPPSGQQMVFQGKANKSLWAAIVLC